MLLIFSCSPIVRICAREDSCFSLQTLEWQQQAQLPQPINNARINIINFVLNFLEKHLSFAYVTEFFLGMQNIDPQKKTCLKNVNVDFMLPATKWCD